jgi:hypothetical protein
MDAFSSRRQDIDRVMAEELVPRFRASYGRAPTQAEMASLRQDANLATRHAKPEGAIDWDAMHTGWAVSPSARRSPPGGSRAGMPSCSRRSRICPPHRRFWSELPGGTTSRRPPAEVRLPAPERIMKDGDERRARMMPPITLPRNADLNLPGWDDYSVWGWDDREGSLFAQLWGTMTTQAPGLAHGSARSWAGRSSKIRRRWQRRSPRLLAAARTP